MANTATVYNRLKAAIVADIAALNLTGDDPAFAIGSNVYSHLAPDQSNALFPCVIVTGAGESEEMWGGTTEHHYHWLPVRVFIADHETSRHHEKEADYLAWRKSIQEFYDDKRRPEAVPEVQWCDVVPQVIFDDRLPFFQYIVSGLVLKIFTREPRD